MQNFIDLISWIKKKRSRKIFSTLLTFVTLFVFINVFILKPKTAFADTTIGLNEGYGSTTYDSNGGISGGTITGAVWRTDDLCFDGKCLYFDGSGDSVSFADDADLDIEASDQVTIEGWFRTKDYSTGTKVIVGKGESAGADGAWGIGLFNGSMLFSIDNDNVSTPSDYVISTSTFDDNKWHHFAAVKNGTSSISLYVDGNLVGTDSSITSGSLANDDALILGNDGDTAFPWDGFIDQIKIYRSARTEAQIKADFAGQTTSRATSSVFGPDQSFLSNGLLGYWKLDESSWSNNCSTLSVVDYSGNGANLRSCPNTTGPTGGSAGKFGLGGTFDGSNDYLETTSTIYNLSGALTLSAWVYITGTPSGDVYVIDRTNNSSGYSLGWNSSRFPRLQIGNGSSYVQTTGSVAMALNTWYHLVGTVDSDGVARIYLNGRLEATGATSILTTTSGQNLRIGSRSAANTITGRVDEVRIYAKAMTPVEVLGLYEWSAGPVAYWNFDQGTGQSGSDISGNNFSLTLGASSASGSDDPEWTNGKVGSALKFDGSDDYATVADSGATQLDVVNELTISAWIYKTGDNASGSWADMVVKGDQSATSVNYWFQIYDDSGVEYLDFFFTNGGGGHEVRGTTPIALNTWQYVTVVYNDAANTVKFYVNGVPQSGANVVMFGGDPENESLQTNDEPIRIGHTYSGQMFPGIIDDVKIYNYARSDSQIISDMNGGQMAPVGYWKMDDGAGTVAQDSTPNNNDLTLSTASWTNAGKFGNAWNGDGTNPHLSRSDDSDFDFESSENFTLSTWVKSDSASNPAASEYIVDKQVATNNPGYNLLFNTSGQIVCQIDDDTSSFPEDSATGSTDYYDNTWHHVACVRDIALDKLLLYVDGKLHTEDSDLSAVGSLSNADSLTIGAQDTTAGGTDDFSGDIDEVKIYRLALNPSQIQVEYNQSFGQRLGAVSTDSSGNPSWSATDEYCPPGQGSTCTGPIAHWKLDENTGTNTYDSTGNGNNSTTWSGTNTWSSGKYGSSLKFDNNNGVVRFAETSTTTDLGNGDSYTISAWFKTSDVTSSTDDVVAKHGTNTGASPFRIYLTATSRNAGVVVTDGTNATSFNGTASLNDNSWHQVVAVRNVTTDTIYLYVDGVLANSATDATSGSIANNDDISIGNGRASYTTDDFNGQIDDVRIYNYARTASQIAWDYGRGAPVAWWKFDEGTDSNANDSSERGNTGTVNIGAGGSQTTTTQAWSNGSTGKFNGSLNLDGNDDYVTITESDSDGEMDFNSGDVITISAWINPTNMPATDAFATIIGKNNSGNGDGYYAQYQGNGALEFCTFNSGNSGCIATIETPVVTGSWQHVAYSVTLGTDSTLAMYYNGRLLTNSGGGTNVAPPLSNDPIVVGANNGGTETMNGKIDDVRIFRYALTNQQLKNIMSGGSVRFGPASGQP